MAETTSAPEKLPFFEKVGYSLADGAAQFVFLTMVNYQASFYTDAMNISAGEAGLLVLVARLWDAFFDPMMGIIADRTRTRWGKFRPWLLWTSVPWGVTMVLAYTVPSFQSHLAVFLYALITNILLMTLYSMNNTPYSALMAVMTGNVKERTNLSQFRFVTAMVGQLIVGGFTLTLVNNFGGQLPAAPIDTAQTQLVAMTQAAATQPGAATPDINNTPAMIDYRAQVRAHASKGWQTTMELYAVICVVCFLLTFFTVRERLTPAPKPKETFATPPPGGAMDYAAPKLASQNQLMLLLTNGPWWAMFLVTITHYVLSGMRGSAYNYYFTYVLDHKAMLDFVHQWHIPSTDPNNHNFGYWLLTKFNLVIKPDESNVAAVAYGLLQMTLKICSVIGIVAASTLVMHFSKKLVVALSLIINTVFILALYAVRPTNIWGVFFMEWLGALAYAPVVPLLWVLFADVCDYTEWFSGRRITGFIYATFFFALKAGISLGGFLGLEVMQAFGYKANQIQTAAAKQGIILTFTLIPGIFSIGCALSMGFYKITKKFNQQISDELAQRRAAAAAEQPAAT